jgi:23S rRNA (pseudouridine1915-N3)-methyltransferase
VIRVLVVGKLKAKWAQLADADYRKRLSRFARVELIEIPDSNPDREGKAILAKLGTEPLISCDPNGEIWTSEELARRLGEHGSLSFCIGGPDGLSKEVLESSRESFAFGRVTLPHELARVTLLEQLYRGHSILGGHPYHR